MAKNFPYFKFIATDWLTGDIVFESLSAQGLFINICAIYWQRDGVLTIEEVNKRYKSPNELKELSESFLNIKDGFINIQFLDEQLINANHKSKVNAENGAKGGLKKKANAKRTLTKRLANFSKEEEEQEREKEINKKKEEFYNEVMSLSNLFPNTELLNEFYNYWSELSQKTKTPKMKKETMDSWETSKRLSTWFRNAKKFNNTPQSQYPPLMTKNEQRFNKFQEASDGAAAIIRAKYGIKEDS